jgi:hypothetical protein
MKSILSALLAVLLVVAVPAQQSWSAGRHKGGAGAHQEGLSAAQAADIARRQTGGRVLAVKRAKDGFRVKVLTPKGEVRYVPVRGAGR